ncbi:MAG: hypothetical protein EOO06_14720 [Chitinophagaceae bacterium]|nr:MAG: hypothetical protein EOO06_14720 [Chitinophagaceae bacterium]
MRRSCPACILLLWTIVHSLQLSAQPVKLYLNPATAGAAPQSNFVEITSFIPVSSPDQKIAGAVSIIPTANYLVLYDYNNKQLFFLSKEARFIKKLDIKKYGDAEIIYDNKKEVLKFNLRNKHYILTNTDLEKIRAKPTLKANQKYFKNYEIDLKNSSLIIQKTATDPYFIGNANWFYDDYYYRSNLASAGNAKDTLGYELEILKENKPVRRYFPFNRKGKTVFQYAAANAEMQLQLGSSDARGVAYTSRPFLPYIYRLDKDTILPLYEIVLPVEHVMPAERLKSGFSSKADWQTFQTKHAGVMRSLENISNTDKYLFFSISSMRNYESYVYDKSAAKFYKTKMIKADSTQFNIQLLNWGLGKGSDKFYYSVVPAKELVEFYKKNKGKSISYPAALEKYLLKADNDANPVIIQYKLKD